MCDTVYRRGRRCKVGSAAGVHAHGSLRADTQRGDQDWGTQMARRLLFSGLLAVAAFAQIHAAAAQSTPPFPHLGAYLIQGSVDFVAVPHIENLQVAVFSNYPGYSVGGKTLQQQVAAVKALNPNMKITAIHNIMEVTVNASSTEWTADVANNWFLRSTYPDGEIVPEASGVDSLNITSTKLAGGKTYRQWQATYAAGFSTAIAPNLDGIYTDNFYYQARVAGDYLQNGTSQSPSVAPAPQNWRNAYADYVVQLRAAMGSKYMAWGNVADWGDADYGGSIQGYNQILNGGVFEGAIGMSWSAESRGWLRLMTSYATVMKALAPFNGGGPYLIINQDGSLTDYQGMRYGLASTLLDNGYFYYTPGPYDTIGWFDEFAVNLGAAIAGPNNAKNGTYSSGGLTVWKQGVYRRDFANGIALVNPKGNGTQTVTLETTYKHFSGTQDPSVNNGQSVTSVTLNDRDGVILLRTTPAAVPDAPTLTVQ
jgi:hypothetical protein